ncbi:alpha/beta fold hydrolase [Mycolicibacterium sp. BK634]|uniref:alpha/beta fold hydrolase n=1 Tax=Mycolicibacterium sp. BK634 TaxID=2587099 RepID=UPI00161B6089|nr:alpha/beta hydrolase [Mycolicibacterium sp. BK634]
MDLAVLEAHRRHATTESGPISYLDVGHGRPALFVHGVLTNGLLWRHVIPALSCETRRCIALDLPGHGHTPPAAEQADVSLTGLAQRVIELCDYLGLQRFDLVANDTGGAIAQIVAAQLGDRLATLTLTNCDTEGNTPPPLFKPVAIVARPWLLAWLGPRLARRRRFVRPVLSPGYHCVGRVPDDVIDAYAQPTLGTPSSARALGRLIRAIRSADLAAVRPQLTQFTVPTLLVWGTGDPVFDIKWAHRLADLIPGTTSIHTLRGARLFYPDERAAEFWPLLRQHWAAH